LAPAAKTHLASLEAALGERFKAKTYEFRLNMQLCGMLSSAESHMAALMYAKAAARAAHALLNESLALCLRQLAYLKALVAPTVKDFDASLTLDPDLKATHDLALSAKPILDYLDAKMRGKTIVDKPPKISMRSTLGVQRYSDWIYSIRVEDLMQLEPLTMQDIKSVSDPLMELSRDRLVEKVCKLVGAYYCVAKELRLCSGQNVAKLREAQLWHHRSLEVAQELLPRECALVENLRSSYGQHFLPSSEPRAHSASSTPSRGLKDSLNGSPYTQHARLSFKSPSSRLRRLRKPDSPEAERSKVEPRSPGKFKTAAKDSYIRRTPTRSPPLPRIA